MTDYTRFLASVLMAAAAVPAVAQRQAQPSLPAAQLAKRSGLSAMYDRVVEARQQQVAQQARRKGAAALPAAPDGTDMGEFENFGWLTAPNGEYWYYTANYRYTDLSTEGSGFSDLSISGFTLKVYDAACQYVGGVDADIPLLDDEVRISKIDFSDVLSKKFFNVDNNYEIMVLVNANTPKYINNVRTYAFSITPDEGKKEPVATIDGMLVGSIDASPDQWAENFYFIFDNDGYANPDGSFTPATGEAQEGSVRGQRFTVFKKAGYSGGPSEVDYLDLTSDEANYSGGLPILLQKKGNTLYIAKTAYEKPYLLNPDDYENMDITPDNHLIVTLYSMPLNAYGTVKLEEQCRTSIAMAENPSDDVPLRFYGVGTLNYMDDMQIGEDGKPSYIVVAEDYHISTDGSYYSFYEYNAEGEQTATVFEEANNYIALSPVAGHPEQMLFVTRDASDVFDFHFVNMDNYKEALTLPAAYEDNTLTTSIDRVAATGGSYDYIIRMGMTEKNEEGHLCECINVFHADGTHAYKRLLYLGADVAIAMPNITATVLNPYFVNTDDQREYFFLVGRYTGVSSKTRTELLVLNDAGETVFRLLPEETKGSISRVWTFNTDTDPRLVIVYRTPDLNHFYTEIYPMPLTSFAGGTGTKDDPYQVATAGDLQQLGKYPDAHFAIVKDIDASLASLHGSDAQFTGTLKGNGHVVSNLLLSGRDCSLLGNIVGDGESEEPTVSHLTFARATLAPQGVGTAALLASSALQAKVEDVHVYGLKVYGSGFTGSFGGLLGNVSVMSKVSACSVEDAVVSLPASESVGGLCASLRTSSSVVASKFGGSMVAKSALGGIAGEVYENGGLSSITDCHVDAALTAEHTIGGIVGSDNHNEIARNRVEGSLTATTGSKWSGPCIGGIVGVLEMMNAGKVAGNVVCLDALNFMPVEGGSVRYETAHRIAGQTVYNETGTETDNGLAANYVEESLSPVSTQSAYAGAEGAEGESIARGSLTTDFFKTLGYGYGASAPSPWKGDALPRLYFEGETRGLVAVTTQLELRALATGEVLFLAPGGSGDDITVSVAEDGVIEVAYIESRNEGKVVAFDALKPGVTTITARCGDYTAQCVVTVQGTGASGIDLVGNALPQTALAFDGGQLSAAHADAAIRVCDAGGRTVAQGMGSVSVRQLLPGIYVATAEGSSMKFIVK